MLLVYLSLFVLFKCFFAVQLNSALRDVDKVIGQLMNGLKQMKLHRCINIILVGDHGIAFLVWGFWDNFVSQIIKMSFLL